MILYLVRHGQTDWNLENRVQGRTDTPLNETGIAQAESLAEEMAGINARAVCSSDLRRALVTAEKIRSRLGLPPEKLCVLPELTEVDFGPWEGKTLDEIRRIYPEDYRRWVSHSFGELPPGGEKREDILRRIGEALSKIAAAAGPEEDSEVIIVAHGGILLRLMVWLLREDPHAAEIRMENASIAKMVVSPDVWTGRLLFMNHTPWKTEN